MIFPIVFLPHLIHLLSRVGARMPSTDSQQERNNIEVNDEEERRRGEIRSERETKERQAELVARLSRVEEEGERLGQEVARLADSDDHDYPIS